jgi:hypothetical protein
MRIEFLMFLLLTTAPPMLNSCLLTWLPGYVRTDLPPLDPTTFGTCSRALIGGAQPYMVGGPPSHSAIKERWGPGLAVQGSPRRQSPHRHPNPNPIKERGAASDGKFHQRHPTLLHRPPPSPPNRWHRRTTPTPALPAYRLLPHRTPLPRMVCDFSFSTSLPLLFSRRSCNRTF